MLSFSFSFQKKQRFERKSTQEVTIYSPCTLCKGRYLIVVPDKNKIHMGFLKWFVFLQTPTVTLERFLEAMSQAVEKQKEEKANLVNGI